MLLRSTLGSLVKSMPSFDKSIDPGWKGRPKQQGPLIYFKMSPIAALAAPVAAATALPTAAFAISSAPLVTAVPMPSA